VDELAERLTWGVPYLTAETPGTGGVIRTEIDDFIVDEVPAYEPCGDGEHTYFGIEKRGISTTNVANQLAQKLGLRLRDVSFAGRKDTHAITRQSFCVHSVSQETIEALELDNARVLWVSRHRNKLRMGHLRGNRFTIRIRDVTQNAATRAEAILERLARRGVPNAYGPQRFGSHGDNQIAGYHLLHHDTEALKAMGIRRPRRRMFDFYISALQSSLFNRVVATRINAGTLDTVITGDIAKKEDTGGIFTVEDAEAESPRAAAWEISATGPMFGYKVMRAQADAGEIETRILAAAGIGLEDFRAVKAQGVRRPMRYNPKDLTWTMDGDGQLVISFFAPKGSFATMLLRELMKTEDIR
jgi:tRNA pseudouridine13 synthase